MEHGHAAYQSLCQDFDICLYRLNVPKLTP
jgi:hypothetical protein